MTYGEAYRTEMTGEFLKVVLEDVADNIFNPDPYYQQGWRHGPHRGAGLPH